MSDLTREDTKRSLELARYCVAGVSTLAKQGCIAAALVEARDTERARAVAYVRSAAETYCGVDTAGLLKVLADDIERGDHGLA